MSWMILKLIKDGGEKNIFIAEPTTREWYMESSSLGINTAGYDEIPCTNWHYDNPQYRIYMEFGEFPKRLRILGTDNLLRMGILFKNISKLWIKDVNNNLNVLYSYDASFKNDKPAPEFSCMEGDYPVLALREHPEASSFKKKDIDEPRWIPIYNKSDIGYKPVYIDINYIKKYSNRFKYILKIDTAGYYEIPKTEESKWDCRVRISLKDGKISDVIIKPFVAEFDYEGNDKTAMMVRYTRICKLTGDRVMATGFVKKSDISEVINNNNGNHQLNASIIWIYDDENLTHQIAMRRLYDIIIDEEAVNTMLIKSLLSDGEKTNDVDIEKCNCCKSDTKQEVAYTLNYLDDIITILKSLSDFEK